MWIMRKACIAILLAMLFNISSCYSNSEEDITFIAEDINYELWSLFDVAIVDSIMTVDNPPNYEYRIQASQYKMERLRERIRINMLISEKLDKLSNLKEPSLDGHWLLISSKYKDEYEEGKKSWYYEYHYDGIALHFRIHIDKMDFDTILIGNIILGAMGEDGCKRIFDSSACGPNIGYSRDGEYQEVIRILQKSIKDEFKYEIWPEIEEEERDLVDIGNERIWEGYKDKYHKIKHDEILTHIEIIKFYEKKGRKNVFNPSEYFNDLKNYVKKKDDNWNIPPVFILDNGQYLYIFLEKGSNKITIITLKSPSQRINEYYFRDTSILFQIYRVVDEIEKRIQEIEDTLEMRRENFKDDYRYLEVYLDDLILFNNEIGRFEEFLYESSPKAEQISHSLDENTIIHNYEIYRIQIKDELEHINRLQEIIQRDITQTQRKIDRMRFEEQKRIDETRYLEQKKATDESIRWTIKLGKWSISLAIISIAFTLLSTALALLSIGRQNRSYYFYFDLAITIIG